MVLIELDDCGLKENASKESFYFFHKKLDMNSMASVSRSISKGKIRKMATKKTANRCKCLLTYSFWKNIIDRAGALVALLVFSPLIVAIAIIIRLDSKGNPIFSQERVGKDGRTFVLHKFRTMYKDHDDSKYQEYMQQFVQENSANLFDESGNDKFELIDDPRITRVGSILRRSNLDELPQLINMVKGEMSLIGPRPDIPFAVEFYKEHHKQRFQVKPGVTGLWQIHPDRRRISFEDTIQLDVDYINRQSLWLDIKIIFRTIFEIMSFGSHQQGVDEVKMTDSVKNGMKA